MYHPLAVYGKSELVGVTLSYIFYQKEGTRGRRFLRTRDVIKASKEA